LSGDALIFSTIYSLSSIKWSMCFSKPSVPWTWHSGGVECAPAGKKNTSELGKCGRNGKIYQLKSNSCYTHTLARHCSQSLNTSLWRPHCITLSPVSYWTSYSLSCMNKYSALIWLQLIKSPWNNTIILCDILLWLNISHHLKHDAV